MRKIRLTFAEGLSRRLAGIAVGMRTTTVADYVARAQRAGLGWQLPEGMDDDAQPEARLFVTAGPPQHNRPLPDWLHGVDPDFCPPTASPPATPSSQWTSRSPPTTSWPWSGAQIPSSPTTPSPPGSIVNGSERRQGHEKSEPNRGAEEGKRPGCNRDRQDTN
jgi:hypothetical protein